VIGRRCLAAPFTENATLESMAGVGPSFVTLTLKPPPPGPRLVTPGTTRRRNQTRRPWPSPGGGPGRIASCRTPVSELPLGASRAEHGDH
jgi:hypothetical protein